MGTGCVSGPDYEMEQSLITLRQRDEALRRVDELEAALRLVMVGGNHCALLIGADHPPADASHETARKHYSGRQEAYEAWCCWQTIMMARVALQ